ncbi:MAG: pseudouridine synthase [Bacteroidetes bacterium]|nr:pseudouridine synthase [Bacteroidota bacterium]
MFGNGNKGRSAQNTGSDHQRGSRFSGGRKPSPAGDGTGYGKSGRSSDSGRSYSPRSTGSGSSRSGEDRPFNRSYNKPLERGTRTFFKTNRTSSDSADNNFNKSEGSAENEAQRPYRKRIERQGGGDSSSRPFNRTERSSDDRPFRSRPERGGSDASRGGFNRSDRFSSNSDRKPFASRGDRPERESGSGERSERPYGDRPSRSPRPDRFSSDSSRGGFKRPDRSSGDSDRKSFSSRSDRPARESGSEERSDRSYGDRPARSPRPERFGSDSSRGSFKRPDRSSGDSDRKPFSSRGDRPEREPRSGDRPDRSSIGDRPYQKREERSGDNKFDRSSSRSDRPYAKQSGDRPFKRSSDRSFDSNRQRSHDRPGRGGRDNASALEPIDETKEIRLNKYISNCGYCSRREADTLIVAGAVKVNGVIVMELGSKVLPTDKVQIGDMSLAREPFRYVLLNKPKDYITTSDDPFDRKTVMSLVENACRERIYPVGRLDRNTSGLLLFTNDGELAKKLTHPKYGVRKVYHVELDKALTKNDLLKIGEGISLDEGVIEVDEIAYVNDEKKEIGLEIHSGQNRVVRRIFESLGYEVVKLDRVIFANLTKKDLPRGRWRHLEQHELNTLKISL